MRWKQHDGHHISIWTPAKLNLHLEILGKRPDGYHELETVMVAIDHMDRIEIRLGGLSTPNDRLAQNDHPSSHRDISLTCGWDQDFESGRLVSRSSPSTTTSTTTSAAKVSGGFDQDPFGDLPTGPDNLVYRAAELFLRSTGLSASLQIELFKRIPSVAGLGGASGNAAGTLMGLNALFGAGLSVDELSALGAELGSDVPAFVHFHRSPAGVVMCEGRGEIVTPLDLDLHLDLVVVRPPFGLSTREIFSSLEAVPVRIASDDRRSLPSQWRSHESIADHHWPKLLVNRLQPAAAKARPEIEEVCTRMNELGCVASQMTGSGSSCFGICRSTVEATRIAKQFAASGDAGFVFTCQNLREFSVPIHPKSIG